MSAVRFLMAVVIVIVALLVAPAAIAPGFNGADLVVAFAPIALLYLCMPAMRTEPPAGDASDPAGVPHVESPPAGPRT